MTIQIAPAIQRAQVETQARLLTTERAAQAALAAAVLAVRAMRPSAGPAALRATSEAVRDVVASAVVDLRQEARTAGRYALAHELRVAAEDAGHPQVGRLPLAPAGRLLADQIAARRAGNEYAATWLEKAADEGQAAATRATRYRLDSIAGAESAQAFGAEREAVMRRLGGPDIDGFLMVLKIWNARLDACRLCRRLDGQVRPVGIGFTGNAVAGSVHRRCRCIAGILLVGAASAKDAA